MKLLPHQHKIVDHIISHNLNDICITLDMGLGKTITALEILKKKNADNILIITKTGLENTILKEIALHNYFKGQIIDPNRYLDTTYLKRVLSNKNTIKIGRNSQLKKILETSKKYNYIIVDEISLYKNYNSNRSKLMYQLRDKAKHCIGLTGTPIPRHAENLFAITKIIDKGERLSKYITHFRDKFASSKRNISTDITIYQYNNNKLQDITHTIQDIFINAQQEQQKTKQIKLITKDYPVNITTEKINLIQEEVNNMETDHRAVLKIKELQASNGFIIINKNEKGQNEIEDKTKLLFKDKINAIRKLAIDKINNGILITYQNEFFGNELLKEIKEHTDKCEMFTGTLEQIEKWNNKDLKIIIAQTTKIAYGYNLQKGGNTIIIAQATYDAEIYSQVTKRLYRKGQTKNCYIYRVFTKNTIEENVIKTIDEKIKKQDQTLSSFYKE